MAMDGEALSAQLGPLPPMRIHCAQLVEGALRQALGGVPTPKPAETVKLLTPSPAPANAPTLVDSFSPAKDGAQKTVRVILKPKTE
jgi:hypothetical protein